MIVKYTIIDFMKEYTECIYCNKLVNFYFATKGYLCQDIEFKNDLLTVTYRNKFFDKEYFILSKLNKIEYINFDINVLNDVYIFADCSNCGSRIQSSNFKIKNQHIKLISLKRLDIYKTIYFYFYNNKIKVFDKGNLVLETEIEDPSREDLRSLYENLIFI